MTVGALVLALRDPVLHGTESSVDWLPIIESTVNDLIFGSIAVFFLWALPERAERRTLLDLLHRLRSLAHVVDMHQLDKDPEQTRADYHPTSQSPARPIMDMILFQPVLDDPVGYVANDGSDNRILFGALLELLLILANIGTAVVIYPIVKRQNHVLALGYVTARIVECTFILVGILAVLSIVTLSQQNAGGDEGAIAYTLAALKDWTFILGPGFIVGWGNGLILGYLMYASGLMPRRLAMFGLVGGPLIIITGVLVMFGVAAQGGTLQGLATIPEFIWGSA